MSLSRELPLGFCSSISGESSFLLEWSLSLGKRIVYLDDRCKQMYVSFVFSWWMTISVKWSARRRPTVPHRSTRLIIILTIKHTAVCSRSVRPNPFNSNNRPVRITCWMDSIWSPAVYHRRPCRNTRVYPRPRRWTSPWRRVRSISIRTSCGPMLLNYPQDRYRNSNCQVRWPRAMAAEISTGTIPLSISLMVYPDWTDIHRCLTISYTHRVPMARRWNDTRWSIIRNLANSVFSKDNSPNPRALPSTRRETSLLPIPTTIAFKSSIRTVCTDIQCHCRCICSVQVDSVFNSVNVANVMDNCSIPIGWPYSVNQVISSSLNEVRRIKSKSTTNTDNSYANSVPMFYNTLEVSDALNLEVDCIVFAGVCVDNMGHIIVVECKVMRVFIFDINGNVLSKFTCSKYLEFPNGVCCNDKQEIFISDNRAHCIKVFSYNGQFLRSIGSEGVTNYPIGVVQNSQGDVLIADNHNNFNLTIFTQGRSARRAEETGTTSSLL